MQAVPFKRSRRAVSRAPAADATERAVTPRRALLSRHAERGEAQPTGLVSEPLAWNRKPTHKYRWRCGRRRGLWYDSYEAAGNAAVKAGLASWAGSVLYTGPLVDIESRPVG